MQPDNFQSIESANLANAREHWASITSNREEALLRIEYINRVCALAMHSSIPMEDADKDAIYLLLSDCNALCTVALFAES